MDPVEPGQRVKQAKLEALRRRAGRPEDGRRRSGVRRAGNNRLLRTIGLGSVAVVLAIAWLVREFQLDVDELLGYLGVSVMFVLAFAACGAAGFALLWLIKRMRRPRG